MESKIGSSSMQQSLKLAIVDDGDWPIALGNPFDDMRAGIF
jgi:hypothetical protein